MVLAVSVPTNLWYPAVAVAMKIPIIPNRYGENADNEMLLIICSYLLLGIITTWNCHYYFQPNVYDSCHGENFNSW